MAQFAPVAPIQILERMKELKCLGTYHLLLAHHVLEHPDRFKALFNDHGPEIPRIPQSTIIMDNSIVELGASENEQKVLDACKAIQSMPGEPHWIIPVLTDVYRDGPATREAATKSYDWWEEHDPNGFPLMVVLQGGYPPEQAGASTEDPWQDFCRTADYFLLDERFNRIEYAGIPRVLVENLDTRQLAVQYVDAIRPDINVHLLGFSDDVTDDVICSQHPSVEGIDSAVPIRYSYSVPDGRYTPTAEIPARPKDWFENGGWDDSIWYNLEAMRRWIA